MTNDYRQIRIESERWQDIVGAKNEIITQLPHNIRRQLNSIWTSLLVQYGVQGVHARLSGKTVGEILDAFDPNDCPEPVKEGKENGTRFRLFDPPSDNDEES